MYADDVVFYTTHKHACIAENLLQSDATRVYNWFSSSGLCINTSKTQIVMFNDNISPIAPTIVMGGFTLSVVTEYEYLGVIIDNKLNFNRTVNSTISTACLRLYLMGKIRKSLSLATACLIYKQTILPVIDYCSFIYNGLTTTNTKKLQHVQNRCLRTCLITNMRHPVVGLHKKCGVDYLDVRFDIQLLTLMHKLLYSGEHMHEEKGLIFRRPSVAGRITRVTGTAELIYPHDVKLSFRKSPLYRGIDLWNKLPPVCRLDKNRESFKRLAKITVNALCEAKRLKYCPT